MSGSFLVTLGMALGAGGALITYLWAQNKKGGFDGLKDSNDILRKLNDDLKSQLSEQQLKHEKDATLARETYEKQLAAMQKQIDSLQTQVRSLEQANNVLQNTVTGKDVLTQIQQTLENFATILPIIEEFKKNDQLIIGMISQLLNKKEK